MANAPAIAPADKFITMAGLEDLTCKNVLRSSWFDTPDFCCDDDYVTFVTKSWLDKVHSLKPAQTNVVFKVQARQEHILFVDITLQLYRLFT